MDGPPLGRGRSAGHFQNVPETFFVSGGEELITADGPPLGRGPSARAPTASSDTHNHCTLTHWFIRAYGPVFEPQTIRDYAEKSVTASF